MLTGGVIDACRVRPRSAAKPLKYEILIGLRGVLGRVGTTRVAETMAPYEVGRHKTEWPLPRHMVLSPEAEFLSGVFWDGQE